MRAATPVIRGGAILFSGCSPWRSTIDSPRLFTALVGLGFGIPLAGSYNRPDGKADARHDREPRDADAQHHEIATAQAAGALLLLLFFLAVAFLLACGRLPWRARRRRHR